MFSLNPPYLLYIADSTNPIRTKMTMSAARFIPEQCVGYMADSGSTVTVPGLENMGIDDAISLGAKTFVLGVVNGGGFLDPKWFSAIESAIVAGMDIVNGMHVPLGAVDYKSGHTFDALAKTHGVQIHDVRLPKEDNLVIGLGKPRQGKRLLTVGTDCSTGKMYTSLILTEALQKQSVSAQFIATGQCGILIAGGRGVGLDAVPSDFISGAIDALLPDEPDSVSIIEGQGSLMHPSYAGVTLGLLHGAQPDYIVVCHDPTRQSMSHCGYRVPSVEEIRDLAIQLGRLTNPAIQCVGVSLNTSNMTEESAKAACEAYQALGVPVTDPQRFGVDPIVDRLKQLLAAS